MDEKMQCGNEMRNEDIVFGNWMGVGYKWRYWFALVIINQLSLLTLVLLICRYYKVNEVQKFTYSRRKDANTSDVTVINYIVEYHRMSQTYQHCRM